MNNVISLKKISNVTEMVTDEDYHIPAVAPYLEEHLQINKELFFNSKLMPAWFHLSHLGLDYDKHSIMEADEVHAISSSEDLQSYRFKQNPKRPNIKKSVVGKGKDFRQKPIFVVKERLADGTIKYCYVQDGNTWVDIGKESDFPNYLVIEFWKNSNWSVANAITIGVYLNLLAKSFGEATGEDMKNALSQIMKTEKFKDLMKNVDKNFVTISEMLTNYYIKMSGNDNVTSTVTGMINDLVFAKDKVKQQNANPTNQSIYKALEGLGFVDNDNVMYSVHSAFPSKIICEHLAYQLSKTKFKSTRLGVISYTSGSVSHEPYWWVEESYNLITEIERFCKLHEGSTAIKRFFLAGIYQNHVGTTKFKLGTIVHIEEIKAWYEELVANGEIKISSRKKLS